MTGVEILQAWYTRVWEEADLNAVSDYFDTTALANGLMTDLALELEDFKVIVPAVLRLVRDVNVKIAHSMEAGDKAWALVELHGKNAENMAPVICTGQVMITVKNNKIIEAHNHFDFVAFFEQIGFLPPNTIALCLSGEILS